MIDGPDKFFECELQKKKKNKRRLMPRKVRIYAVTM